MFDFFKKQKPISFPDDRTDYDKTNQEEMRGECNIVLNIKPDDIVVIKRVFWGKECEETSISYRNEKNKISLLYLQCSRAQHNALIEMLKNKTT